jgi:hypothetical protein
VEKLPDPVEKNGLICGKPVESLWNPWGKLLFRIRIANKLKSQGFLNMCKGGGWKG